MKFTMQTLLFTILIISLLSNFLFITKLFLNNKSDQTLVQSDTVFTSSFSNLVNNPKTLLLDAIKGANETLDIAIYNLQDKDIADEVLQARERGVFVRLITDTKKAKKGRQATILKSFIDNGITVKTNPSQKMHLKMTIVDKTMVITGSYNYTEASAYENQEQLLTIQKEELAKEWTDYFVALWNSPLYKTWNE